MLQWYGNLPIFHSSFLCAFYRSILTAWSVLLSRLVICCEICIRNQTQVAVKFRLLLYLLLAQTSLVYSQTTISGYIRDTKGESVPGANIYFEGTFEGTTSDSSGFFNLATILKGERVLLISYMGYESYSQSLELTNA
ncbi:MAG: carboxypeptidase-like regulatory domain-containing protein, partial [Bacteroidia bacterium]